jgi:hypothetical protein
MDLRIDEVIQSMDIELGTEPFSGRKWIPWVPPREGVLQYRTTRYINYVGSKDASIKLNRKAEVIFSPADLGLSAAAQVTPQCPSFVSLACHPCETNPPTCRAVKFQPLPPTIAPIPSGFDISLLRHRPPYFF